MKYTKKQKSDYIADSLVDHYLAYDPNARVSLKVLLSQNMVFVGGELTSVHDIPNCLRGKN